MTVKTMASTLESRR